MPDWCDTLILTRIIVRVELVYHLTGLAASPDGRTIGHGDSRFYVGDAYPCTMHAVRAVPYARDIRRVPWNPATMRYEDKQGRAADPTDPPPGDPWPLGEACRIHIGRFMLMRDGAMHCWTCSHPGPWPIEASRAAAVITPAGVNVSGMTLRAGNMHFVGAVRTPPWVETALEGFENRCSAPINPSRVERWDTSSPVTFLEGLL